MVAGNVNPAGSDPIRGPQPLIGRTNIQGTGIPSGTPSTDGLGGTIEESPVEPSPPPLSEATPVPPPSPRERANVREGIISSFNLGEVATSILTDAVNRRHPLG